MNGGYRNRVITPEQRKGDEAYAEAWDKQWYEAGLNKDAYGIKTDPVSTAYSNNYEKINWNSG
jgi:hypothetical protein